MRQQRRASEESAERLDREIEQYRPLDWMELRRLAWAGVKLLSSFLHRWLNLCEVGAEEIFFALTMLRPFSGVNLDPAAAPQEAATLNSPQLFEEQELGEEGNVEGISASRTRFTISWRTPWLYLIFALLLWLLLF